MISLFTKLIFQITSKQNKCCFSIYGFLIFSSLLQQYLNDTWFCVWIELSNKYHSFIFQGKLFRFILNRFLLGCCCLVGESFVSLKYILLLMFNRNLLKFLWVILISSLLLFEKETSVCFHTIILAHHLKSSAICYSWIFRIRIGIGILFLLSFLLSFLLNWLDCWWLNFLWGFWFWK